MKKLILISALLFLGTFGHDVLEAQGQSKLQMKHIDRACALVANTPKYLTKQKFTEEAFKLEDLTGRDTYMDDKDIDKIYGLMLELAPVGYFLLACQAFLTQEFHTNFARSEYDSSGALKNPPSF